MECLALTFILEPAVAAPGWGAFFALAAVMAVAAGVVVFTLYRRWVLPVRRLAKAADRLAAGDWTARAAPQEAGALQGLCDRLNRIAEQAERQLDALNHQRGDLTSLVDSLPDPILLTDEQQRIILINAPATRFLQVGARQAMGRKLMQVVNDGSIIAAIEGLLQLRPGNGPAAKGVDESPPAGAIKTRPNGLHDAGRDAPPHRHAAPVHQDLRVNRNGQRMTYQAVVGRTDYGGTLLVLRDVSRLSGAVQMKTDFVANASHELRTPIAAIKLAFETLTEVYREDQQQSERCIAIIDGHIRRLEEMLSDLLDLSRVENAELKPQIVQTRASEVLANVRSAMGAIARNKQIELTLSHDAHYTFHSDRRLLDLVLKNLIENSMKFTAPGGSVIVTLADAKCQAGENGKSAGNGAGDGERGGGGDDHRDRGDDQRGGGKGDGDNRTDPSAPARPPAFDTGPRSYQLTVRDTGIGIPPEHLERVFERFYQVDAARSGSAGRGTGLGLAIVKHAVNALGGTVAITSTPGVGTTVNCVFPDQIPPSRE